MTPPRPPRIANCGPWGGPGAARLLQTDAVMLDARSRAVIAARRNRQSAGLANRGQHGLLLVHAASLRRVDSPHGATRWT
jgi:hypothetical protein